MAGAHGLQKAAYEIVFVDCAVAVHGSVALDQGVNIRIVERAHDNRERMPLERVGEGGEFPGAEVTRQKQNSFAPGIGAFEVLESVVNYDLADVFTGVLRKQTNFRRLPSEGGKNTAQDSGTLAYGQTVSGTLTNEKFINTYSFTGKSGDLVTITMKAAPGSTLDSFVELLGSDKARLAANDDAPAAAGLGKTDAQIASFKLPYNGTFTIRATRFGRETTTATGAYTLTLDNH